MDWYMVVGWMILSVDNKNFQAAFWEILLLKPLKRSIDFGL